MMIAFTWHRDEKGYDLLPETLRLPARIVGKGGSRISYRPLEVPTLFRIFANIQKTPEGALGFIENFGPLGLDGVDGGKGEKVSTVIQWAGVMESRLRRVKGRQGDIPLNRLEAHLVTDRDGVRCLEFRPSTLIDALWLQLGQELSGGTRIHRCILCHQPFRVGPGAARRADATFCSDEHRIEFNSLKRSR
jgi:hypothetical protein